jgi:hypothetical protein
MGMDVMGKNPTNESGEYFRNNIWWWHPLWEYCIEIGRDIINDEVASDGHMNSGTGLSEAGAATLAERLNQELWTGRTLEYHNNYYEELSKLPRQDCKYCDATGIRTDEVGQNYGFPTQELSEEQRVLLGRTHGYCNACHGEGQQDHPATMYSFSVENVAEFAQFLENCGGFEIW